MCTNSVPPALQMFTGCSTMGEFPIVPIKNHHGTCTPIFIDSCCLGGFGGLWGAHTGNAIDTTMSTNIYKEQDLGDIFEGGLKGWMTNFFAGSWGSAQQIGYYAVPNLVSTGVSGAASIFGYLGKMCS